MTKFFAIVSPVLLIILVTGWATAATPAKRCVIVTEGDGTQVIVCPK